MSSSGIALQLLLIFAAWIQGAGGIITGTLTDPDGERVAGAFVQAKDSATGTVYRTESSRTGTFTLPQLPAGKYELSVPEVGFKYDRYVAKDIALQNGQTLRQDIRLKWDNQGVFGDDSYLAYHNKYKSLNGPAPRTADGKPDFSGIWNGSNDANPEDAEALPWVEPIMKERVENHFRDLPGADCLPANVVPAMAFLYKVVQTPSLIVQLFEEEPHFRQIYLDSRSHPQNPDPSWTGHSIGRWDGDTLVIDTVGFNDKAWLPNGMPHTEKLHVVERYRRPDLSHLNIEITIEDPGALKKPWHMRLSWELAPQEDVFETVCENNHYRELAGGK
jgi:hypothetical protein